MARQFYEVVEAIKEVAPDVLAREISRNMWYWAPEIGWEKLSWYVNKYVEPSSKNPEAVAVYAILCDCSEAEMKARFEANNL